MHENSLDTVQPYVFFLIKRNINYKYSYKLILNIYNSIKKNNNIPGIQTQRNVPGSSKQLPSFWHGWLSHSLTFVSQRGPVKPCVQLQTNEPGVLTQTPLCSHGDPCSHSSMSTEQSIPLKPVAHEHVNEPLIGLVSHMASEWHGFDVHASSKWHNKPVFPGVQRQ